VSEGPAREVDTGAGVAYEAETVTEEEYESREQVVTLSQEEYERLTKQQEQQAAQQQTAQQEQQPAEEAGAPEGVPEVPAGTREMVKYAPSGTTLTEEEIEKLERAHEAIKRAEEEVPKEEEKPPEEGQTQEQVPQQPVQQVAVPKEDLDVLEQLARELLQLGHTAPHSEVVQLHRELITLQLDPSTAERVRARYEFALALCRAAVASVLAEVALIVKHRLSYLYELARTRGVDARYQIAQVESDQQRLEALMREAFTASPQRLLSMLSEALALRASYEVARVSVGTLLEDLKAMLEEARKSGDEKTKAMAEEYLSAVPT